MAYQRNPSDLYTRQNRASTEPGPVQPSFPRDAAIPPSLRPGHRHRQTISVTGSVDGLLFSQADSGTPSETVKVSATVAPVGGIPDYYYVSPSPYHGLLTPPPPPLLPPHQQAALPPLPPKAPILSPSTSPMLPPKPPPFMPSPPPYHSFKQPPRSKSQPPPPLPRGASPPFNAPLPQLHPPPMLPPKPHAARSTSVIVTPTYSPFPSVIPREKASPNSDDAASLILPSLSPVVNEEEELELALKLSAHADREYTESLLSQDEELARALEESLLDLARPLHPKPQFGRATTSESDRLPTSSLTRPSEVHPYSPKQPPYFPLPVRADSSTSLASLAGVHLKDDEAYARKLEAEYESGCSTPTTHSNHNVDLQQTEDLHLPRYADIVKDTATPHFESDAAGRVPHVSPTSTGTGIDERHSVPHQTSTTVPPQQTTSSAQRTSPRPASLALSLSASEEEEEPPESSSTSPRTSRAFVTPNQFIEPELLYGASFGFHVPPMDVSNMRDPLPNIIALPYGKCPPMHVQAPSWRQLLKLMAKLSATQIEPSTEALTVTKGELKLRTVIQFFKVHRASPDWRTVIYLTIDYPPPPDHRYTNGDVNVLPYSYNLSALPTLLSDGPESHVSKYYTIPATSRTPLPKLPITMPSMAMYLASALDDSRRALSDTSSGVRRLAKMVDQFYPNESAPAAGEEEVRRRGGRALIGRLMGRTSKPQRGRNADVYDLVTPFVPDEWG